jgi:hypothetical protein
MCAGVACSELRASSLWACHTRGHAHSHRAHSRGLRQHARHGGRRPGKKTSSRAAYAVSRGAEGGGSSIHHSLTHTAQVRAARQAAPARVQQPVHLRMASRRRQLLRVQPASVLRTVRVWV